MEKASSVESRSIYGEKKQLLSNLSESHGSSSEERDPTLKQKAIFKKLSVSIASSMNSHQGSNISSPDVSPKSKPLISVEIQHPKKSKLDLSKIENTSKLDVSEYLINKSFR